MRNAPPSDKFSNKCFSGLPGRAREEVRIGAMGKTNSGSTIDLEGKYLTFFLDKEEYGVPILKVREIIGVPEITQVPKMPLHCRGVINVRGNVIPVFDLRLALGFEQMDYTKETCIVVVETASATVGLIVDTVSEVMELMTGDIQPCPSFGGKVDTETILGIGKVGDDVRILLNTERLVEQSDITAVKDLAGSASGESGAKDSAAAEVSEAA